MKSGPKTKYALSVIEAIENLICIGVDCKTAIALTKDMLKRTQK